MDWNEVIDIEDLDYIIGNPPFVGGMLMSKEQKEDMKIVTNKAKGYGNMDFVCGWYFKSAEIMNKNKNIRTAFVSTNSICQGEHVLNFWKNLVEEKNIKIDYCYRTFKWSNEAKGKAAVYCVIVGFSNNDLKCDKKIFIENKNDNNYDMIEAKNINPYLIDAKNVFIERKSKPICDVPEMKFGSMPRDGGYFILTDEEREEIIKETSEAEEFIKKYIGAREFINKTYRWVLWLDGVSPKKYMYSKLIRERLEKVKEFRLNSTAKDTRDFSKTLQVFCSISQPKEGNYLLVPSASSSSREYVPIGFIDSDIIASNLVFSVSDATLYEFGVITSKIHMDWMSLVAGRLGDGYRYSNTIVYNNFILPDASDEDKEKIIKTASKILEVREKYSDWTFAEMYDPLIMPLDLRKAHEENDKAVEKAYGRTFKDSSERIEFLLQKYSEI